jgi:glycosyltransferase involved in cell wall biosynthesis
MKIGIEASVLERTRTGISRYLTNLLREWNKQDDDNTYVLYFKNEVPADLDLDKSKFSMVTVPAFGILRKGLLWENFVLPLRARKDDLDVFFSPHYTLPLLSPCKKQAVTIFDVSFIAHPEWVPLRNKLIQTYLSKLAAKRAFGIITGLDFTRNEIAKYAKIDRNKIEVIPAGVESKFKQTKDKSSSVDLKRKYNLREKVILSVGLLMQRRRQDVVIKAFHGLCRKYDNISLLVAGPNRFHPFLDIRKLIKDLDLEDRVTYVDFLPEEELVDVYNLSDIYINISQYEGEALTLREAMICGIPSIVSEFFEAVVNQAGFVVKEPLSEKVLADAIERVLTDNSLRVMLREQGLKKANSSWESCAKQTLSFITGKR